ncbi:hypothetical protein DET50_10777 [Marinobacter pelagius]|uniref:DUF7352 domain-containing protein n=1 Tax=Marinobacter pelagius TaxID=379482 RepID=A0A366GUC4_9GAMM|nr:hypothetical protein DET50_10777 [Marinobacter pelagius]
MKTTSKYLLCFGQEPTELMLMPDFRVVLCEYLVGAKGVYLWVEQSPVRSRKAIPRHFIVARPGKSVPENYEYIDSAVDPFGSRAHHVFQLPVKTSSRNQAPFSRILPQSPGTPEPGHPAPGRRI